MTGHESWLCCTGPPPLSISICQVFTIGVLYDDIDFSAHPSVRAITDPLRSGGTPHAATLFEASQTARSRYIDPRTNTTYVFPDVRNGRGDAATIGDAGLPVPGQPELPFYFAPAKQWQLWGHIGIREPYTYAERIQFGSRLIKDRFGGREPDLIVAATAAWDYQGYYESPHRSDIPGQTHPRVIPQWYWPEYTRRIEQQLIAPLLTTFSQTKYYYLHSMTPPLKPPSAWHSAAAMRYHAKVLRSFLKYYRKPFFPPVNASTSDDVSGDADGCEESSAEIVDREAGGLHTIGLMDWNFIVDTYPANKFEEMVGNDNIHPTAAGSNFLMNAILNTLHYRLLIDEQNGGQT